MLAVLAIELEIPTLFRYILIGISAGLFVLVGAVYYFYVKTIKQKR